MTKVSRKPPVHLKCNQAHIPLNEAPLCSSKCTFISACKVIIHWDNTILFATHAPFCILSSSMKPSSSASDIVQDVIKLTPGQWNLLTAIKTECSLYQELSQPFRTNPDVKIELLHEDVAIRFEGKQDSVRSAHGHFSTQLKYYIPLEQ